MASLAPGLSLACQQAMSATKIDMLVLMRVLTLDGRVLSSPVTQAFRPWPRF